MANLLDVLRRPRTEQRMSLGEYSDMLSTLYYNGVAYPPGVQETWEKSPQRTERADSGFELYVDSVYRRNGIVFACEMARLKVFTEARFQFQRMRAGRPGDLYGTPTLGVLETPWPNGTTGDLLARMLLDADLAGNSFGRRTGPLSPLRQLERFRPDWMSIVLGTRADLLTPQLAGYMYMPGGPGSSDDPVFLAPEEVWHWAPIPDPSANYRGMSWLTPVLRDIRGDDGATTHKLSFWEKAATPNLVVTYDASLAFEQFQKFKSLLDGEHKGAFNAWKTMHLGGGADVTVVGNSFKDMDYRAVQGAGETRIAAAAGVPPIVVGLSEGLDAATYSNYAQARRAFADTTVRALWRGVAASLASVIDVPSDSRLWYDDRDIAFLQEDRKDAAEVMAIEATAMASLVPQGFKRESIVAAMKAQDWDLLEVDPDFVSVQLQQAAAAVGAATPSSGDNPDG